MSLKRVIIIVVVVAIAGGAYYGYKEFNRKNEDLAGVAPTYIVKANDLIGEFANNDSVSINKYLGKVIGVDGLLKKVEKDDEGFVTIVIGDTTDMSSVRCAMDTLHFKEASNLKPFSSISVKGYFTGYEKDDTGILGADIKLNRCVIMKNEK
jgi:hypothetical protein